MANKYKTAPEVEGFYSNTSGVTSPYPAWVNTDLLKEKYDKELAKKTAQLYNPASLPPEASMLYSSAYGGVNNQPFSSTVPQHGTFVSTVGHPMSVAQGNEAMHRNKETAGLGIMIEESPSFDIGKQNQVMIDGKMMSPDRALSLESKKVQDKGLGFLDTGGTQKTGFIDSVSEGARAMDDYLDDDDFWGEFGQGFMSSVDLTPVGEGMQVSSGTGGVNVNSQAAMNALFNLMPTTGSRRRW